MRVPRHAGKTYAHDGDGGPSGGSPAHAGIDPASKTKWSTIIDAVSPAHAGIDPTRCYGQGTASWFPRPRGDRPLDEWVDSLGRPVPPPTRG